MDRISTDDVIRKRKPVSTEKKHKRKSPSGGYYHASASKKSRRSDYYAEKKDVNLSDKAFNSVKTFCKNRINVLLSKSMIIDKPLLIIVVLLLTIGLIMMYSASYAYAYYKFSDSTLYIRKQLAFALFGVLSMFFFSTFEPKKLKGRFTYIIMAVSYFLLIIVLFLPRIQGVRRWINFGFTTFQPSEIAKFAVILWCANYISTHYKQINVVHYSDERTKLRVNRSRLSRTRYELWHNFQYAVLPFGLALGPMLVLIVIEPHLSCTVLVVCIIATMMYVGGTKKGFFGVIGALGAVAFFLVVYTNIVPYGKTRIDVWQDPFVDKLGTGWQNIQSLYAISSGGLFGVGLGNSRQKYLYISEPQNDFIFAVVCEELGLIGAAFIVLLFVLFVYRGLSLSISNPDRFSRLLGIGITSQIGFQALLNVCVVTKIVPNTGISLPFFSSGGTSLLMLLTEIGVLMAVSRQSTNRVG